MSRGLYISNKYSPSTKFFQNFVEGEYEDFKTPNPYLRDRDWVGLFGSQKILARQPLTTTGPDIGSGIPKKTEGIFAECALAEFKPGKLIAEKPLGFRLHCRSEVERSNTGFWRNPGGDFFRPARKSISRKALRAGNRVSQARSGKFLNLPGKFPPGYSGQKFAI